MSPQEIKALKQKIRCEAAKKEKTFSVSYKEMADAAIRRQLLSMPEYQKARTVFCFVSMKNEIRTGPFLEQVLHDGKRLAVPLCTGKGIMEARQIFSLEELEEGSYGIPEPRRSSPLLAPEEIDFAVIPCVTCSKDGVRLGHGGGYYDRYFADRSDPFSVVICRSRLLWDFIPQEAHDCCFSCVLTEHERL